MEIGNAHGIGNPKLQRLRGGPWNLEACSEALRPKDFSKLETLSCGYSSKGHKRPCVSVA